MVLTMVWSICAQRVPLRARRWIMISSGVAFLVLYTGFVVIDVLYSPRVQLAGTGYTYVVRDTRRQTLYWLAFDPIGASRRFFTVSTPVYRAIRRGDAMSIRVRVWSAELDHIAVPTRGFDWDEREQGGMLTTHIVMFFPAVFLLGFTLRRAYTALGSPLPDAAAGGTG